LTTKSSSVVTRSKTDFQNTWGFDKLWQLTRSKITFLTSILHCCQKTHCIQLQFCHHFYLMKN